MSGLNITVLGAGVIGLTTAVELQKRFRNAEIDIIADKFYTDTTSFVAAGLFRPNASFKGPSREITQKWVDDSYYYWCGIQTSAESERAGVLEVSGYMFSNSYPHIVENDYIKHLVPLYRRATEEELTSLLPKQFKYGSFFTTLLTDCSLYLPWAMEKFQNAGGKIRNRKIESFSDIPRNSDIVINCTGLGAKWLCNDDSLIPIRGQVLKVEAPFIKTFFYEDQDTYIIPGYNSVTLGGIRGFDSFDLNPNKYDSLSINERCTNLVPSLKTAKPLGTRVGLRPHRNTVRVEKEIKDISGRRMKIVHNYGHGGYGVTTAPGTSLYAVELVKEFLLTNSKL